MDLARQDSLHDVSGITSLLRESVPVSKFSTHITMVMSIRSLVVLSLAAHSQLLIPGYVSLNSSSSSRQLDSGSMVVDAYSDRIRNRRNWNELQANFVRFTSRVYEFTSFDLGDEAVCSNLTAMLKEIIQPDSVLTLGSEDQYTRGVPNIYNCEELYMQLFLGLAQARQSSFDRADGLEDSVGFCNLFESSTIKSSVEFPISCVCNLNDLSDWNNFQSRVRSRSSWEDLAGDHNMQTFVTGGLDKQGVPWLGIDTDWYQAGSTFSEAVGEQMLYIQGYSCSLESPCTSALSLSSIGSWTYFSFPPQVLQDAWVNLMVASLQNINLQLLNQYNSIKGATISTS